MINFSAIGQNREILKQNKFNSATFKNHEIEVKKKWFDSVKINFPGDVEFIDKRADESKLGFVRMGDKLLYYNIILPAGNIEYINSKFQHILRKVNNENKLQIVIRHMWMSHIITNINPNKKGAPIKEYVSYCYFKADYYYAITKNDKLVLNTRFAFGYLGYYNKDIGPSPFENFSVGGDGMSGCR